MDITATYQLDTRPYQQGLKLIQTEAEKTEAILGRINAKELGRYKETQRVLGEVRAAHNWGDGIELATYALDRHDRKIRDVEKSATGAAGAIDRSMSRFGGGAANVASGLATALIGGLTASSVIDVNRQSYQRYGDFTGQQGLAMRPLSQAVDRFQLGLGQDLAGGASSNQDLVATALDALGTARRGASSLASLAPLGLGIRGISALIDGDTDRAFSNPFTLDKARDADTASQRAQNLAEKRRVNDLDIESVELTNKKRFLEADLARERARNVGEQLKIRLIDRDDERRDASGVEARRNAANLETIRVQNKERTDAIRLERNLVDIQANASDAIVARSGGDYRGEIDIESRARFAAINRQLLTAPLRPGETNQDRNNLILAERNRMERERLALITAANREYMLQVRAIQDSVRLGKEAVDIEVLSLTNRRGEAEISKIVKESRQQVLELERNQALSTNDPMLQRFLVNQAESSAGTLLEATAREQIRSSTYDLARRQMSLPTITSGSGGFSPGLSNAIFAPNTQNFAPDSQLVREMEGLRNTIKTANDTLQKLQTSGGFGAAFTP